MELELTVAVSVTENMEPGEEEDKASDPSSI